MENQTSFAQAECAGKKKQTRRERFLSEMEGLVPWARLVALIVPFYPKGERGLHRWAWRRCCACTFSNSGTPWPTKPWRMRSGGGKGHSMVLFGWNYYVGIFTGAIIAIERLLIRYVRVPRIIAEGLAGGATLLLFLAIAYEWVGSVSIWIGTLGDKSAWSRWLDWVAGTDYLCGYIVEALPFLVIFRLMWVEIFNLAGRRREEIALRRVEN